MARSRRPHLLVAIDGNIGEWRDTLTSSPDRPRLPLPYAFGAATFNAGFRLSAIDLDTKTTPANAARRDTAPFDTIFPAHALASALRATDFALLWGRSGLSALARQAILPQAKRRLLYFSYAWTAGTNASWLQRSRLEVARQAARFARGVVLMTSEQAEAARATLPRPVPVIALRVGIDCRFYTSATSLSDVAEADRPRVERLLQRPYVVMPGDELRLNEDALAVVENSPINLVRICQFGHRNGIAELRTEIRRRNLDDRLVIFQRISYPALRFLMRHAVAYAGLVDASWQPAGWTAACESLASGLPVVLYEGLTSRELGRLGAGPNLLRSVPIGDTKAFADEVQSLAAARGKTDLATEARTFAAERLDLERTGAAFGQSLTQATGAG